MANQSVLNGLTSDTTVGAGRGQHPYKCACPV